MNSHGNLAFYDFKNERFGRPTPSARLFREGGRRRAADLEERLNTLIETPLSRARDELLAPGQIFLGDWKVGRAVVLAIFLQAPRTYAMESRSDRGLSSFLTLPDDQIDQLTMLVTKHKQFVRLGSSNPAHALFCPSGGIFSFLARDPGCLTGWSWGMAIPMSPSIAFAWVSETADCEWLFEQCTTSAILQGFSLSGPKASRIVIPPLLLQVEGLASWIVACRHEMDRYRKEVQDARAKHLRDLQKEGAMLMLVDGVTQRFALREEGAARKGVLDVWEGNLDRIGPQ